VPGIRFPDFIPGKLASRLTPLRCYD
jgi:hypothetical protein